MRRVILALLTCFGVAAAAQGRQPGVRRVWTDQEFENWVFNHDGNAAAARRRCETLLKLQVDEIDHTCRLSDAQKQKLHLMGRGDVKQVFDAYDRAKHRFTLLANDRSRIGEVIPDTRIVATALQEGIFTDDSLLMKSLPHVLAPEQAAKYDAVAKDRRALRHRTRIEFGVGMLEEAVPLRDRQRHRLIELLEKETKPARMVSSGWYDYYLLLYHLERLQEKVKPLFTDAEWKLVTGQIREYRGVVPNLRANGLMGEDDEAGDVINAPAGR
jgi:hypothetical protein